MEESKRLRPVVTQEVIDTFVRRWGDMGAVWGINRTMAEIQGLLYISGATLCADEIVEKLGISRGNASMSLRALVEWGVVRKHRSRGDRRDHFESLSDVWEILTLVIRQRKKKEIDPILATLRECQGELEGDQTYDPSGQTDVTRDRLEQMLDFLSTMEFLSQRFMDSDAGLALAVSLLAGQ